MNIPVNNSHPQISLEDLHRCPICDGKGWHPGNTGGRDGNVVVVGVGTVTCRTCGGSGTLGYDPDDKTIPY